MKQYYSFILNQINAALVSIKYLFEKFCRPYIFER